MSENEERESGGRARAERAAHDPRIQRLIRESGERHAAGRLTPDRPEGLDERLERLRPGDR